MTRSRLNVLTFFSKLCSLFLILFMEKSVYLDDIDNNIMKMTYSNDNNKYIIALSGYNIENSHRKCALQYKDIITPTLKAIPRCKTDIADSDITTDATKCIYECKPVKLQINGDDFKNIKYIRWCQGKTNDEVKACSIKRIYKVKDLYLPSILTVEKDVNDLAVKIKSKEFKGCNQKVDGVDLLSQNGNEDFYREKSINVKIKQFENKHSIEFSDKSPEVMFYSKKNIEDVFIATGSKHKDGSTNYYTLTLQNPNPSKLCYFGIKEMNDLHFSSNCSIINKSGPCIQPCYRATLMHDRDLNFAQVHIKQIGGKISKEFIQTVTFGSTQPDVSHTNDARQVTVNLSDLNKNEGQSSGSAECGAKITEIKLIKKYMGISSAGDDVQCSSDCKNFETITIENLTFLTEYILKIRIEGLLTVDSSEVNHYHRYIYFKTKGESFKSNAQIKIIDVANKRTEVDVTLQDLFASENEVGKKCELYYSIVRNEVAKFPATCRKDNSNTFCSDSCSSTFHVVNLNPKTNNKFFVCSKGYTCKESQPKTTTGITISIAQSNDIPAEKTTATISSSDGNLGGSFGYALLEKSSQKIILDCLNTVCDPPLQDVTSTKTLDIPWALIKADITYKLIVINMDHALPVKTNLKRHETEGKENMILKFDNAKNKYAVKFKSDFLSDNNGKQCSLKKSKEGLSDYENAGDNSQAVTKNCEQFGQDTFISLILEKSENYLSLSYEKTITKAPKVEKSAMSDRVTSESSIGKIHYISKSLLDGSEGDGTPAKDGAKETPDQDSRAENPAEGGEQPQDPSTRQDIPSDSGQDDVQAPAGGLQKPDSPPQQEIQITVGMVFSYHMDNYEEFDHIATLDGDKIIFKVGKCSLKCKGYKDKREQTPFEETQNISGQCTFGSYSTEFDELVEDYHIICPEYFDFHYYYDNTWIKNNAPFFSRFYYNLKFDGNNKLGITLVNDNASQICTFEWVDATATSPKGFFSNYCDNNKNCVYSLCSSVTFGNINDTVKTVKIRVLKLGMKPQISYQNNVYLLKHGTDIPATSVNKNQIKINISANNKDEDGNPVAASSPVQCVLKIWNTYAPLLSENGRKQVDSPSNCEFKELDITTNHIRLPNDIMVAITNIPNYNPRKYFYHKTIQSNNLSIRDDSVKPTADGFTLTPGTEASAIICTIYVKEKTADDYFTAICSQNELCVKKCNLEFTITGLYSGVAYDIKIIPSGDYNAKTISNKATIGKTIEFKVSPESTKSFLKIIPNEEIESASSTNCYYQLYKVEHDLSTKILQSCVECDERSNKIKKCNEIEFDDKLYSNKYNYRLMIYASGKSSPVKILIPKYSRHGNLEQKLTKIENDRIDKITIGLSDFPANNQCALKITKLNDLSLFQKPSCNLGSDEKFCIIDCGSKNFDIGYIYSKIDRYVPICYGANDDEAKKCKHSSLYHLKMDYIQRNTYELSHADGEIRFSYKTISMTNWKVSVDGINDLYSASKLNDLAVVSYSSTIENKVASFSLDRLIEYYNIESTNMWPGIFYYTNNTYLCKNTPLKSQILYTLTKLDDNENKLNINFSPGPYNDEVCHITVFKVKEDGNDEVSTILNNFGGENGGIYQLCQDSKISFEGQRNRVGVIVKRRFDSAGFTQYYLKGDNGFTLGGITETGVTLSGLEHYKNIITSGSTPTCTIKISKLNIISTEINAQNNSQNSNTNCDNTYTINGLIAATNYIISVKVTNLGISGDYSKKFTFRTGGGTELSESGSDIQIKSSTTTMTPFQNNPSIPICRIFLKKKSESSKLFMAACRRTGACVNKCDSEMIITNLELGVTYDGTVEPSDGIKIRTFEIVTVSINPTVSLTLNRESDLKAALAFTGKDNSSKCPFMLHEKIDDNTEQIVTWCRDEDDCSSNQCVINITGLSKEKDYKLRVKVKDYSKYHLHTILSEQKLRSEYTNIDVDDTIQKVIVKVEKGLNNTCIDSKDKVEFEAAKNSHSFYAMLPIAATLMLVIGIAIYRRDSKDFSYDL